MKYLTTVLSASLLSIGCFSCSPKGAAGSSSNSSTMVETNTTVSGKYDGTNNGSITMPSGKEIKRRTTPANNQELQKNKPQ